MADFADLQTTRPSPDRLRRREFAIHAHEIEGNPLDAADIALLKRFDRKGLTTEERVAAVVREAQKHDPT